ncbi:hypothetical protein HK099_007619 [Clydaea vesicula]|uniref:BAG domain-containing protein n=1 Tax=Clydaea vesicula TaxID=447962 RepID=A0AAD5XTL9_9FUNG|nr:hypothetical protein HK099_007619 [Clydaea vesicula]
MSVFVKYKSKKIEIKFPFENWEDKVTLKLLKEKCSEATKVKVENIKLLTTGVVMKDDNAVLSRYKVKNGSKIVMLGDNNRIKEPPKIVDMSAISQSLAPSRNSAFSSPVGERITIKRPNFNDSSTKSENKRTPLEVVSDKLLTVSQKTSEMQPLIKVFADKVLYFSKHGETKDLSLKILRMERFKLTEMFMKNLLELDGLEVNLDSSGELRAKRKELVKVIQKYMEEVDNILKLVDSEVQPI